MKLCGLELQTYVPRACEDLILRLDLVVAYVQVELLPRSVRCCFEHGKSKGVQGPLRPVSSKAH